MPDDSVPISPSPAHNGRRIVGLAAVSLVAPAAVGFLLAVALIAAFALLGVEASPVYAGASHETRLAALFPPLWIAVVYGPPAVTAAMLARTQPSWWLLFALLAPIGVLGLVTDMSAPVSALLIGTSVLGGWLGRRAV